VDQVEVVLKEAEDSATGLLELHLYRGDDRVGQALAEPRADRSLRVERIFVDEEQRGLGLGTYLLQQLERVATERGFLVLVGEVSWLSDDTPSADACAARAAWFAKRGFTVAKRHNDDWDVAKRLGAPPAG
jgi:GNAT superfamily N-acetyltransferase